MSIKQQIAKQWAKKAVKTTQKWAQKPIETQKKVLMSLVQKAKNTTFGKDHDFQNIQNEADFSARVPVRDYEGLRPYIDRVVTGEADVLWPNNHFIFPKLLAQLLA